MYLYHLRTTTLIAASFLIAAMSAVAGYSIGSQSSSMHDMPDESSFYLASDCGLGIAMPNHWYVSREPSLVTGFQITDPGAERPTGISFRCYDSLSELSYSPGHGGFNTLQDYLNDPMFHNVQATTLAGRPAFRVDQDNNVIDYRSTELFIEVNGRIYNIGFDRTSPAMHAYEEVLGGMRFSR